MSVDALLLFAGDDRWDHMHGSGAGWLWVFGISMMALLVLLIVWLIRTTASGATHPPSDSTGRAREILAERYARGELTTDEYRERLEQLR